MEDTGESPGGKGASHSMPDRESCAGHREVAGEALTAGYVGGVIEHRNGIWFGVPKLSYRLKATPVAALLASRGRAPRCLRAHSTHARPTSGPGRAVRRPGEYTTGPHREGKQPKPMMYGAQQSDAAIVAMRTANKGREPGGVVGAKGRDREESETARHCPDIGPVSGVSRGGADTVGRERSGVSTQGRSRMR